jgi:tape measure domain-containing protein
MNAGNIIFNFTGNTKDLNQKIKEVDSNTDNVANSIVNGFKRAGTAIAGATVAILGFGVKYNASMEQYNASFKTMLGSEEQAQNFVGDMKKLATATPFEFSDLAKASQTLMAFGFNAQDTTKYIKVLGDISQGNKDKLDSLSLAFAQMSSTGHLMGQDLLQMINAGFNPLQVISQKTGKSIGELKDEMADGAITASMVQEAFVSATQEGGRFYGAMDAQSKTLAGQWSTLKDNASQLAGTLAQSLSGTLTTKVLPALNDLAVKLNEKFESGNYQDIINKLKLIGALTVPLMTFFGVFAMSIKIIKAAKAVSLFFSVMAANPILLIISAIAALVVGFIYLWNTCDGFRNFFINMWNAISNFFTVVIPQAFQNLITFIVGLWSGFVSFLQSIPQTILNGVNLVLAFLQKIPYYIGYAIGYIIGLQIMLVKALWEFITVTIPQMAVNIYNWLLDVPNKVANMIIDVANWFASLPGRIWGTIVYLANRLDIWWTQFKSQTQYSIKNLISNVGNWFSELPGKMWQIGVNIVNGVWNGIRSMYNSFKNSINNFFKGIVDGVKNSLGIHSPSTVFASIGSYSIKGYIVGIDDMKKDLQGSYNELFDVSPNLYGTSTLNNSPVVNVYNNISYEQDPLGQMVNNIKTFSGGAKNDYNYGMGR